MRSEERDLKYISLVYQESVKENTEYNSSTVHSADDSTVHSTVYLTESPTVILIFMLLSFILRCFCATLATQE